ncbi:hypothetical protein ACFSQT_06580 [Mesorhizobium calcicola]|uniref:Uncharacterized protein n=1 Tax=Mesorhizobium calcicola TaxID=1300310 RepID=A0ABW4WAJ6_9HYPH
MDDISELGTFPITLVIGVEPVPEPSAYLVERRSHERVMNYGVVPLKLLY